MSPCCAAADAVNNITLYIILTSAPEPSYRRYRMKRITTLHPSPGKTETMLRILFSQIKQ